MAADSATAAILAGRLSQIAPVASEHYVALAGLVALLTAGCPLLARLFKLGFLADFLSQTLLVGFLTGVGFQVGIAMLGEMLGVTVSSDRTVEQLAQIVRGLPQLHVPTLCVAGAMLTIIFVFNRFAPSLPAPLFAVVGAIAASAAFDFPGHGIAVIQGVTGGLPLIGLPNVSWGEIPPLLAVSASCFLMIVTQSAATARAYASRDSQTHDENTDLVGLSAANAAAAFSGTFVVNGSPTQTAMVERSGGHSQIAQIATAAVVALVLLFLTGPLHYLPRCVLGAIVFTIVVGLVDVRGLRDIRRESPGEFWLALITAATVVVIGVEQGILLAIGLSLLWHVRHSYQPHTAVLVEQSGRWAPTPAVPGAFSGPGLVIFQFGADLFYANVGRWAPTTCWSSTSRWVGIRTARLSGSSTLSGRREPAFLPRQPRCVFPRLLEDGGPRPTTHLLRRSRRLRRKLCINLGTGNEAVATREPVLSGAYEQSATPSRSTLRQPRNFDQSQLSEGSSRQRESKLIRSRVSITRNHRSSGNQAN